MNLIRQIAFAIEAADSGIDSHSIHIPEYTDDQVAYHCELMHEDNMFTAIDTQTLSDEYASYHIHRLTTKGHDFVDAARDDTIWKAATTKIKSAVGGATIDVTIQYLKSIALSRLGLPGD